MTGFHPCGVSPFEALSLRHKGSVLDSVLGKECKGVGLEEGGTFAGSDFKLVVSAFTDFGHKNFPNAAIPEHAHGVTPTVPVIEVTDDAHALSVGGPDGECGA